LKVVQYLTAGRHRNLMGFVILRLITKDCFLTTSANCERLCFKTIWLLTQGLGEICSKWAILAEMELPLARRWPSLEVNESWRSSVLFRAKLAGSQPNNPLEVKGELALV
jgi:hypothetical protein